MFRNWLLTILQLRCRYDPRAGTLTSDTERRAFEEKQRQNEARLAALQAQARLVQRERRERS